MDASIFFFEVPPVSVNSFCIVFFSCDCEEGFEGQFCQNEIDECAENECEKGLCVDLFLDYRCDCEPGFQGRFCEINIDDCAEVQCLNGATCQGIKYERLSDRKNLVSATKKNNYFSDLILDFKCLCTAGFNGSLCESNIDDCTGSDSHKVLIFIIKTDKLCKIK